MADRTENNSPEMQLETVAEAISSVRGTDEIKALLADMCTPGEIRSICNRIVAARMLYGGGSYQDVINELGLSTATVGRVSRCLKNGSGGYLNYIKRINGEKPDDDI